MMWVLGVVVLLGIASYFIFPGPTKAALAAVGNAISGAIDKLGGGKQKTNTKTGPQQANFTALDGQVKIKRHNSDNWVNADFNTPLEKDDVVQTGPDAMARIVFADGSNYTVKPDSLIVIQENSMNAEQQTDVAVQVTTGTVDLSTATYNQGSKSGVIVGGAHANFSPDSSAQVRSDPRADKNEIIVKKGGGDVTRNNETVHLGEYENVNFTQDAAHMTKGKAMAPPILIAPANMLPIETDGSPKEVDLSWSPISTAKIYRVRVSKNPYFSSTVVDKKVATTGMVVPGLKEGPYYWLVQSVADDGHESIESERNRFTIIPKQAEKSNILLELQDLVQHGRLIEVRGKTEVGARVMVNGAEVPVINPDGSFQFFTRPMPPGENLITVTTQNTRGGVRTEQRKIVIQ